MTPAELASRLELTVLRPDAMSADVHRAATFAMHSGLAALVAPPVWTARLATMLRGSGVRLVSAVGFPFGSNKSTLKAIEATSTIKDGADEIAVVPHLPYLLGFDLDGARAELMEIVRAARTTRRDVAIRVIIETGVLLALEPERRDRALEGATRAVRESGCDGIITATGFFGPDCGAAGPADAIARLKPFAESLTLTAAGITDPAAARAALDAGADRLATPDAGTLLARWDTPATAEVGR